MKNKQTNVLKRRNNVVHFLTFAVILTLSFVTCFKAGAQSINSAAELKTYLDRQPANSPATPIRVVMRVNELMLKEILRVLNEAGKYVSLDLTGSPLTTIPQLAFNTGEDPEWIGCTALTDIIIPSGVTSIGMGAFYFCLNLKSVTIPSSVTSIGNQAFRGCISLKSITIPSSVTSIEDQAFRECENLTSVTIQAQHISFGGYGDCFDGDLVYEYLDEGIGTYVVTSGTENGKVWTKQ